MQCQQYLTQLIHDTCTMYVNKSMCSQVYNLWLMECKCAIKTTQDYVPKVVWTGTKNNMIYGKHHSKFFAVRNLTDGQFTFLKECCPQDGRRTRRWKQ